VIIYGDIHGIYSYNIIYMHMSNVIVCVCVANIDKY
jgi:hypothetical protein